jgi:DNA-binding MarR family transcriptional regulator
MSSPTFTTHPELVGLFAAVVRTSKTLQAALDAETEARVGLSLPEVDVLLNLSWAAEGKLRMSEISECLLVNRTAVTRLVDALERRGLVARCPHEQDRRGVSAALTDAGRNVLSAAVPLLDDSLERLIGARVDADEAAAVRATLERILAPDAPAS